jgi:hypothetical protein
MITAEAGHALQSDLPRDATQCLDGADACLVSRPP